jgi:hypothetical protein
VSRSVIPGRDRGKGHISGDGPRRDDGEVTLSAAQVNTGRRTGWNVTWLAVGRVSTLAALVLFIGLQQINHDYFPPNVSISQYGVGPNGWVFTSWSALTVLGSLAVYAANPVRTRAVGYWLSIGGAGLLLMGIIRTDADGLQHSWHAKVHMISSIVALIALPIGLGLGLHWARKWWRRVGLTLLVLSDAALIMVGVSALGVATPGFDPEHSWALWQSVAATLDMVLLATFSLATFSFRKAGRLRPDTPREDSRVRHWDARPDGPGLPGEMTSAQDVPEFDRPPRNGTAQRGPR